MIVRELITRLGFKLDQGQLNQAEQATTKLKTQGEQLATTFRNAFAGLVAFASIRSMITIADEMQSIRTRIGQLPQTIGDAAEAFDIVAKHATTAGMSITAYSSLYTRVGNAAKDYIKTETDLLNVTDTIANALAVGGASAQEASAAMQQFGQALASGVLQGDEFRTMAEAAPQYLDKLSETMKIPREQLKKMAADGKLTAKAVIEATQQMSGYFADKFKEMPMTVGRAMTVVGNRFSVMLDKMNRESVLITRMANGIIAAFDKVEEAVGFLIDKFGGWGNAIRFVGIALGVAFGMKAVALIATFGTALWAALLPLLPIAAGILLVAAVIEDLWVGFQGGESLLWGLIEALNTFATGLFTLNGEKIMDGLIGAWTWLGDTIAGVIGFVWQLVAGTVEWAASFVTPLDIIKLIADWIVTVVDNLSKAAGLFGLIGAGWDALKGALGFTVNAGATQTPGASVTPEQVAPSAMGAQRPSVNSTTNVQLTVPAGTTAEQSAYLQRSAEKSFSTQTDNKLARDLAVYAP